MATIKEPESMDECAYFSRRTLEGNHKSTLWVLKSAPTIMNVSYVCGKCGHNDSVTSEFKLPFSVNCSKCGETIRIGPLKGKKRGIKK